MFLKIAVALCAIPLLFSCSKTKDSVLDTLRSEEQATSIEARHGGGTTVSFNPSLSTRSSNLPTGNPGTITTTACFEVTSKATVDTLTQIVFSCLGQGIRDLTLNAIGYSGPTISAGQNVTFSTSIRLPKDTMIRLYVLLSYKTTAEVPWGSTNRIVLKSFKTKRSPNGACAPNTMSPTMCVTYSRINDVSLRPSLRNIVSPGKMEAGIVDVWANDADTVGLVTIPFQLQGNDSVFFDGTKFCTLEDDFGNVVSVPTSEARLSGHGGIIKIRLSAAATIAPGFTRSFHLFVYTSKIGMTGSNLISLKLGPGSLFSFRDKNPNRIQYGTLFMAWAYHDDFSLFIQG